MHTDMHWMAVNPQDLERTDWSANIYKYSWVCQADAQTGAALTEKKLDRYIAELLSVGSLSACQDLQSHWART